MALKLAISGKGGVGKSTVAAMFAHLAVADGLRVLAIDADPDANLAAALGLPEAQRRGLVPLAARRALIHRRAPPSRNRTIASQMRAGCCLRNEKRCARRRALTG